MVLLLHKAVRKLFLLHKIKYLICQKQIFVITGHCIEYVKYSFTGLEPEFVLAQILCVPSQFNKSVKVSYNNGAHLNATPY